VFNFGIRSLITNYYKKYICLSYIMCSVSQQEYLTNEIPLPHNISHYHNMQDKIKKLIIYILGSSSLNLVYVVDWYAKILLYPRISDKGQSTASIKQEQLKHRHI
jgi:hypothetical protein